MLRRSTIFLFDLRVDGDKPEALKDPDAEVRKEAIEGLKKIKDKTKEKDASKGKPEERE